MIVTVNIGLQIRDFWHDFSYRSLERWDFPEPKTDMKQMNCYQKYLTSKPISNYYVFFKTFEMSGFNKFCTK